MKIFDLLNRGGILAKLVGVSLFFLFIFFRYSFLSPWLLYSDSYKFLLIARAFSTLQSPLELFPQIAWPFASIVAPYKWLYSAVIGVILAVLKLTGIPDSNQTIIYIAHAVTIAASVSIPYIAAKIMQKSTQSSRLTPLILCIIGFSGAQLIWSGYIVTEQLALALLLLAIYFDFADKKVAKTVAVLLATLTRPEMIVAAIILHLPIEGLIKRASEGLHLLLSKATTALFFLTVIGASLTTAYLTTYRLYDMTTIALLTVSMAFFLIHLFSQKKYALSSKQLSVLLLSIVLTFSYYQFEPAIERYSIVLLPLFTISALTILCEINVKITFSVPFALATLLLIPAQLLYTLTYTKRTTNSYHTEVSLTVIDYAAQSKYTQIYVPQPDPFVFHSFQTNIAVRSINSENIPEIGYNTLIVRDASYPYKNIDMKLSEKDYALIYRFTAREPFVVNDVIIKNSPVELWSKK